MAASINRSQGWHAIGDALEHLVRALTVIPLIFGSVPIAYGRRANFGDRVADVVVQGPRKQLMSGGTEHG